jgi:uncharacterized protein (TIGR03083 family)
MRPAALLLLIEADALRPVLDRAAPDDFDRPSLCEGWSVRDVLAHCGSALDRLVRNDLSDFSPAMNEHDVAQRRSWTLQDVLDELYGSYQAAAPIIDEAEGLADGLGLGEWVHGGDVRDPLGAPDAFCSPGVELAIDLIDDRWRQRDAPALEVTIGDAATRTFGTGPIRGSLTADQATFVRLVAGRPLDASKYTLEADVTTADLLLFS